jgi:Ca-activated chloride channel family protein
MKPGTDARQPQPHPAVDRVVAFLLGTTGTAGPVLAIDIPQHLLGWVLLVAGGVAAGVTAAGLVPRLRSLYQNDHDSDSQSSQLRLPRPQRRRQLLVWSTILASALALGVWGSLVLPGAVAVVQIRLDGCPHPVELRVLTSPDSLEVVSEVADTYERWTAARFHDCPTARLYVYAAPPQEVRNGLGNGWPEETLSRWPRPDVWLADSLLEVEEMQKSRAGSGTPFTVADQRVVAFTPLVLAVPTNVALSSSRTNSTWERLLSEVANKKLHLLRPEPTMLPVGQLATAVAYNSHGRQADLATAHKREQWFSTSLDAGAYPVGDEGDLLCRFRSISEAEPSTVLMLTEQAVIGYNRGRYGVGAACAPASDRAAGHEPTLESYYPTDTFRLERTFVRFAWQDGAGPAEAAAVEFGDWLVSPDGQQALLASGLRASVPLTDPISSAWGALQDAPDGEVADLELLEEVEQLRQQAALHRRVLVLLDTSGSMTQPATTEHSRFEVATDAVLGVIDMLDDNGAFGLWTFAAPGGETAVDELLPLDVGDNRNTFAEAYRALKGVSPAGDTPLYQAIQQGLDEVRTSEQNLNTALIVITDGENTVGGASLTDLFGPDGEAETANINSPRVYVVAVGEANCESSDLAQITTDSGGGCVSAGFDTLDQDLTELARTIWGVSDEH